MNHFYFFIFLFQIKDMELYNETIQMIYQIPNTYCQGEVEAL
jgi:hypothetical protein